MSARSLIHECMAEAVGTFVLVFFGVGVVHAAVLTGAQSGLWQVAVVWGAAVALAIYAVGAVSGAHINPAMTIAFAAYRGFPARKIPAYLGSQLLGAVLAGVVLYALFGAFISHYEAMEGIVRGGPGSELSAMVYGEYFPNPGIAGALKMNPEAFGIVYAMLGEGLGTAFLAFFVFAVTDTRNSGRPGGAMVPVLIGLTVAMIISIVAPLTQAGLNPARDFGPRLVAYFAGWGTVAIPGPRGGFFTVYILSPILGGLTGAGVYQFLVGRMMNLNPAEAAEACCNELSQTKPLFQSKLNEEQKMKTVQMILVGGFLGAGKTTLLWETASRLIRQGKRVGLITNDQAPELVDTELLRRHGLSVSEVAGSCFCCNFNGLIAAAASLSGAGGVDVLIAEPVGSCTDLSATILQPLKDQFAGRFVVSPLSVLVDPARLDAVFGGAHSTLHPSAAYILRKQLEEADMILLSKVDLLSAEAVAELKGRLGREFPQATVYPISASAGTGVDAWLSSVMNDRKAGQTIVDVDYDVYAEGEAVLGWLNGKMDLTAGQAGADWAEYGRRLATAFQQEIRDRKMAVGHIKFLISCADGQLVCNLTQTDGMFSMRGQIHGRPQRVQLIVNARVETTPQELEQMVRRHIASAAGKEIAVQVNQLRSLQPGRPNPTHRYSRVV